MSLRVLASGVLISDPHQPRGTNGPFTTATIRATSDEWVLVCIIAFGTDRERLSEYSKGGALAVSGHARLTSWVGRDGAEQHGLSVIAEQIATAKPRPKPTALRRSFRRPYRASQPMRDPGPPLPADRVDDLYPEALALDEAGR
jgi:hypothetical protein